MILFRMLLGGVGLIVGIVGFMSVTVPGTWGATRETGWIVLAIGVVLWLQAIPILQASEREERRKRIRKLYTGDKE